MGGLAALLWGLHDLCVRHISRRADIVGCIALVLIFGLLFQLPAMASPSAMSDVFGMGTAGIAQTCVAGLLLAAACYGLYKAFSIGPVRIVAPITAAYPVVTLSLAGITGNPITPLQWLAVFAVITGATLVSTKTAQDKKDFDRRATILWSVFASICYALMISVGQTLSATQPVVPTLLITRAAAVVCILILMGVTGGLRWPAKSDWPMLAFIGFLDACALGLVFAAGLQEDGALASVTASLFGVVTILLAWAFLKEKLVLQQWVGVLVTFVAIGFLASA